MVKLCVDCQWFGGPRRMDGILSRDPRRDVCTHAYTQVEDLVRGGKYPPLCVEVRSVTDPYCGVSGRLFCEFSGVKENTE